MAIPLAGDPAAPAASGVSRARRHRWVLVGVLRVVVVTGMLLAVYATAPLGQRPVGTVGIRLLCGLLLVAAVLGLQIRSISRSPHPTLRGVEVVAVSVPLLVLMYAGAYSSTSQSTPDSFSEGLSRLDAAYFAVTVLATVGFGDIVPRSGLARLLVTSQMLVDLALVGLVAKVLVGAVRQRRDALDEGTRR